MITKNFKITIEYDGTSYCSWQIQKNETTVQGVLKKSLENIVKKDNINNSNDKLRSNLKSIREKIEDNYNMLVETEDKINATYTIKINSLGL